MKALVVGSGSIGTRHLKNLKHLHPEIRVALWRQHGRAPLAPEIASLVEDVFTESQAATNWRPDIALLCNPAPMHVSTGLTLAEAGAALFVEKPLSHSTAEARQLITTCRERNLPLFVAYNLQYDEAFCQCRKYLASGSIGQLLTVRAEVGQYLPDWRPQSDYRQGVTAQAKLGGGVLLELSHELDYVIATAGAVRSVSARVAKLSHLEIDVEDTAELILDFTSGALGSVHLDMTRREPFRQATWIGSEGTLTWNLLTGEVLAYPSGQREARVIYREENKNRNTGYLKELEQFLLTLQTPASCIPAAERACHVLEVVEAARLSSSTGNTISLPPSP